VSKVDPATSGGSSADVDAILAGLPDDQRAALERLRAVIRAAAPDADEGLSYGAPAFRYLGRPLVAYAAAKAHCSFYCLNPSLQEAYRAELAAFGTSKGAIRFTPATPIPDELVARIVRDRLAEIDASARKKPRD
jgi:uncharacterized protein YdhG (YjbR/CyaY superfamily)